MKRDYSGTLRRGQTHNADHDLHLVQSSTRFLCSRMTTQKYLSPRRIGARLTVMKSGRDARVQLKPNNSEKQKAASQNTVEVQISLKEWS